MKFHPGKNAFTLIELVLVLSIVAVLISIAAVRLPSTLSAGQIQYAADRLTADLARVRDQARIDQKSYTITFNISGISYSAPLVNSPANLAAIHVSLAGSPYHVTSLACSLNSQIAITFDARGIPSASGSISLYHKNKCIRITVSEGGIIEQVIP